MGDDRSGLEVVLAQMLAAGRAEPAPAANPGWLRDLALGASPDFLTLYRTLAPGSLGSSGSHLIAPQRLSTLHPDWTVAGKKDFLAVIENPHGGVVAWWTLDGAWQLVELYPDSISPRSLTHLGLAGWLREEVEGEGQETIILSPLWARLSLIFLVLGALGVVLAAALMIWLASEAQAQQI